MSRSNGASTNPGEAPSLLTEDLSGASFSLRYCIDAEAEILRQWWRGHISATAIAKFWQQLIADEATFSIGRHLNDLRGCRLEISGSEWYELITRLLERMPQHAEWRAAIVVDDSNTYGVVRQFIGYAGQLVTAEIFNNLEDAKSWLLKSD